MYSPSYPPQRLANSWSRGVGRYSEAHLPKTSDCGLIGFRDQRVKLSSSVCIESLDPCAQWHPVKCR